MGWTRTVVLMGMQAWSILVAWLRLGLSEWSCDVPLEVLRTLEREVEKGHCSWATAEAIARHVDLHGKPWAAETASLVEGLDLATQGWLEGQPWWRRWAMEQVARLHAGHKPEQAFLGDSTVLVRPFAGANKLGRLARQNRVGQMDMHHGPPHHLGWIALRPSWGFALDHWRPQRSMGARPDDSERSDVWDRMACGRPGTARDRAVDAVQANGTSRPLARAGRRVGQGRLYIRGVHWTQPCGGCREVRGKLRRVARPRRLDVAGEP